MISNVHPTSIIHPTARVPESCKIGPYCVIGAGVELGDGCHLVSHVALEGPTTIGVQNEIFPFAAIGMAPQDVTYQGEPTRLEIGDHNEIRESVTINRGTVKGGGVTKVGSHILIMAYTHLGHDCVIGAHSYIGGGTTITQDVLPFSMTSAARETHAYLMNKVGLQRRGFSRERITKIHHAYKILLASKMNTSQALEKLKSEPDRGEDVNMLIRFIEASERGIIK